MNDQVSTRKSIDPKQSALQKTLDIICGKWRLYIIYQIGTEARRYGELRRMIPDVSEKVLIQELKVLVSLGVIEKKAYHEVPPRVEYSLTPKGIQVLPTLLDLTSIGELFMEP
jgi:DNA-binding HxlR family transcriptional regulator